MKENPMSVTALVGGLIALICVALGLTIPALIVAGVSIVLALTGFTRSNENAGKGRALSVLGGVSGGLAAALTVVGFVS